jgi:hypothetical protein
VDIAAAIIKLAPERSFGWNHRSVALHKLERTQEGVDPHVGNNAQRIASSVSQVAKPEGDDPKTKGQQ